VLARLRFGKLIRHVVRKRNEIMANRSGANTCKDDRVVDIAGMENAVGVQVARII